MGLASMEEGSGNATKFSTVNGVSFLFSTWEDSIATIKGWRLLVRGVERSTDSVRWFRFRGAV
jgi:hypothetical protein